jgi:hypothetical protein
LCPAGERVSTSVSEIVIARQVLELLGEEVSGGLKALPKRGMEVGGLLLGRWHDQELIVDGFQPVPIEHKLGPSYSLAPADHLLFERAVDRFRDAESRPIGYYRSHTREVPEPDDRDREIATRYFPLGQGVCLIVKAKPLGLHHGVFFRWDGSDFQRERGELAFPGLHSRRQTAAATPLPEEVAGETMREWNGAFLPAEQPHRWSSPILIVAGLLLLGLAIWSIATFAGKQDPVPVPSALNLGVERQPRQFLVTWDRMAVSSETAGTLEIRDGAKRKQVALRSEDLASGSLYYAPAGQDVHFRLAVGNRSEEVDAPAMPVQQAAHRDLRSR